MNMRVKWYVYNKQQEKKKKSCTFRNYNDTK